MASADLPRLLARWTAAGVIDHETAARIRAFEGDHAAAPSLRWPILVALAFGAVMLASGVLLFVSAHWDAMSQQTRFALVLLLVAVFHLAGAVVTDRFHRMAATLHAVGTVALGAGIFLAGQIFHLDEHWPGGVMLWALGAATAWIVLRQVPQLALTAVLVPAWLVSEWVVATIDLNDVVAARVLATGIVLLSLVYVSAPTRRRDDAHRNVLRGVGAVALGPALLFLAQLTTEARGSTGAGAIGTGLLVVGWATAVGAPLLVGVALRGRSAWPLAVAVLWVIVLLFMGQAAGAVSPYAWWALGAIGLVAWGLHDARRERIDMGAAIFAATVIAFYFSEVMDKLGRSASLVGLGLLFLAGGWGLERVRRRLVEQARRSA